jgi:histidine triad (HIT) family protein
VPQADPNCVFCKIVAGDIPCMSILQTPDCLAFLDIGPLSPGHFLLIPKAHYTRLEQMPPDLTAEIGRLLPKLANALKDALQPEGYNLLQNNGSVAGQAVDHLHFHFIPRSTGDSLGYRWHPNPEFHAKDKGQAILAKLLAALGN